MEWVLLVIIALMFLLSQVVSFLLGRLYELQKQLRQLDEEEEKLIKEMEEIDREIAKLKEAGEDN